jgi:DNA ligase (NAD+)
MPGCSRVTAGERSHVRVKAVPKPVYATQPSASGAAPYTTYEDYQAAVKAARQAAEAYYNGDGFLMDDVTYDELLARITASESAQPAWQPSGLNEVAGGTITGGDVPHSTPMLSLDKAHDLQEVAAWYQRISSLLGREFTVVVEPKLDGVALAARYRQGRLTRIVTRGDGSTGEDVTANIAAASIVGLPERLEAALDIEVRGECYLTEAQFREANTLRITHEAKPAFVNARNAVAGLVRAQNRTYAAPLSFAAYSLHGTDAPDTNHLEQMSWLAGHGFVPAGLLIATGNPADQRAAGASTTKKAVTKSATKSAKKSAKKGAVGQDQGTPNDTTGRGEGGSITGVTAITAQLEAIAAVRPTLDFDIDGSVIKADLVSDREQAGATGAHPRWAIAFKYPAEERTTRVLAIDVTPGRTGALVPRAVLEPVFVAGTTISYATLHNFEILAALDVRIGDTVLVKRAGDVIPRVEGVVLSSRPENSVPFNPPTSCPRCEAGIDRSEKRWRCTRGRACGAVELLTYAAGRDALDIEGLGDTLVARLVDAGKVSDLADIFALTTEDLDGIDRVGELSGAKVLANIEAAKNQPLSRLVTALGVRMTGRRISRRLARHFGTLERLRGATVDELCGVEGVGDARAFTIRTELDELDSLIERLIVAGVRTDEPAAAGDAGRAGGGVAPLSGKTVVVSGSVPGMSRTEAQEAAEALGAKISGTVSKNTDLLVAGAGAGSKLSKAETLGVAVMGSDEFAALVAQHRV